MEAEPYDSWPFVAGLFHSAQCFQGSSVSQRVLQSHSFLRLNNMPLCVHATFVHLSVDGHLCCSRLLGYWE